MPDPASTHLRPAIARTRVAARMALDRRDARSVFAGVTVGYLAIYLWATGQLAPGLGGYGMSVVADPLGTVLRPSLGPFTFEPIATVRLGPVTYLASLNTAIGLLVAALVGLNIGVTYLVWTQPKSCGIGSQSAGILASLPAILSGTACCGPVVLFVLGVQASGVLLTGFQFLLPAAVLLLAASLVLVGRLFDPPAATRSSRRPTA